ncbi:MAG: hypothetical protein ACRDJW_08240 [Thermomicrobiales bacterium]
MTGRSAYVQILRQALGQPRYRRVALVAGSAYLLLYLYALGHLVFDRDVVPPGGTPSFALVPGWTTKGFERIAGYSFEPIAALYLFEGLTIFIAPPNLLIGAALGGLLALNVVTAAYALAAVRSCRRLPWTGLLGSLPGFLTGFACCVPTVALVLGANLALAIISVQAFLLPVSLAALLLGLGWNLRRTRKELLQFQ